MEVPVSEPHTTIWMLGGIVEPITEDAAVTPTA